jgi:hypothetical protein
MTDYRFKVYSTKRKLQEIGLIFGEENIAPAIQDAIENFSKYRNRGVITKITIEALE